MKYLIAFLALLLPALQANSQPTVDWYRTYDDEQHYLDGSTCAAMDEAGNVYVSGEAYNFYTRSSEYDIVTIKYSPAGDQLWVKKYHFFNYDGAVKILCNNNYIYVLGWSQDSTENMNGVVLKYDINGNLVWLRRIGNISYFEYQPEDMIVNPGNDFIYLTGFYHNYDSARGVIDKISDNGNLIWEKKFQFQSYDNVIFESSTLDQFENIIVSGYMDMNYPNYNPKGLVAKISNAGELIWYRADTNTYATEIVCNSQNEIFTTGIHLLVNDHSRLFISKFTSNGGLVWGISKTGGYLYYNYYSNFPSIKNIILDNQQNLIVSSICEASPNRNSLRLYKINTNGNELWQYTDTSTIFPTNMFIDPQNNIYVNSGYGNQNLYDNFKLTKISPFGNLIWKAGNIINFNYRYMPFGLFVKNEIIITSGYSDYWYLGISNYLTIKYTQPIGIQPISSEIPDKFSLSQNYPNPFNPVTKIRFALPPSPQGEGLGVRVTVYDILGREIKNLVNEQLKPGTYEVDFDGTDFPSGVYFYLLHAGDPSAPLRMTKKMILIK